MNERAVTFGPDHALVGVCSTPRNLRPESPIVLLTNAGVLPRQGPHRMNVRIARALAEDGVASLRFDLSGNGDSQSIGNTTGVRAQAVLDIKSAMDWVETEAGKRRFLIFGVCSGAVNAYELALDDDRIAGLMMFDGYWFKSRWTTPVRNFKRAMVTGWRQRLVAISRRLFATSARKEPAMAGSAETLLSGSNPYGNPPLASFVDAMQFLTDRGTEVFFIYSGSVLDVYSYAGQFRDVFERYTFYPRIRCEYHPDIDHTFIARHAQQKMVAIICAWARASFARP